MAHWTFTPDRVRGDLDLIQPAHDCAKHVSRGESVRWRKKQVIAVVDYCEGRNTLAFTAHTQGFWRETGSGGQIEVHDVTRNRRDRAIFVGRFTFGHTRHEGQHY